MDRAAAVRLVVVVLLHGMRLMSSWMTRSGRETNGRGALGDAELVLRRLDVVRVVRVELLAGLQGEQVSTSTVWLRGSDERGSGRGCLRRPRRRARPRSRRSSRIPCTVRTCLLNWLMGERASTRPIARDRSVEMWGIERPLDRLLMKRRGRGGMARTVVMHL